LGASTLSGLPEGSFVELTPQLPPAAELRRGKVEVGLGAVHLRLGHPVLPGPVEGSMAARLSLQVTADGEALRFQNAQVEELHLSVDGAPLDAATRAALEGLIAQVLEPLIGGALAGALPAIPIPSFT